MQGIIGACSEEAVLAVYPDCLLDPCKISENVVQVLHINQLLLQQTFGVVVSSLPILPYEWKIV